MLSLCIVNRCASRFYAATAASRNGVRALNSHPAPEDAMHRSQENSHSPLTVKQVYKNLLHLGKDFPKGYEYFRDRCKIAFMKNRNVTDPQQVEVLLARAVYVTKELEALYMLKKYRTLKKRYYAEELK